MNDPDDKTSQEAQAPPLSDEVAQHLVGWAKTISRWSDDGERSFLMTKQGLRSATPEDVVDAMEQLRKRRFPRRD